MLIDVDELYYKKSKIEVPYYIVTKIRLVFLALYVLDELCAYQYRYSFAEFLSSRVLYLTEWGYFLTGMYFLIMSLDFVDYKLTTRFSVLFSIVFTSQCIITLVYWPLLHKEALNMFPDRPQLLFILYTRHIAPLLFLSIDFVINKVIVTAHTLKPMMMFTYTYLIWNFLATKYRNKPVYDILDFKGFFSVFFVLSVFVLIVLFWRLCLHLSDLKYEKVDKIKV